MTAELAPACAAWRVSRLVEEEFQADEILLFDLGAVADDTPAVKTHLGLVNRNRKLEADSETLLATDADTVNAKVQRSSQRIVFKTVLVRHPQLSRCRKGPASCFAPALFFGFTLFAYSTG